MNQSLVLICFCLVVLTTVAANTDVRIANLKLYVNCEIVKDLTVDSDISYFNSPVTITKPDLIRFPLFEVFFCDFLLYYLYYFYYYLFYIFRISFVFIVLNFLFCLESKGKGMHIKGRGNTLFAERVVARGGLSTR